MAPTDDPHPEERSQSASRRTPDARRAAPLVPGYIAARTPSFYGWLVLGCLCFAGFARQGPAVSTLSVFVTPLIHDFGWSRTALSGAVSLGGILAAIVSPKIGLLLQR